MGNTGEDRPEEQPQPKPPEPRPKRAETRHRAGVRLTPPQPVGPRFRGRLLAGFLGAAVVLVAQAVYYRAPLVDIWKPIAAESGSPALLYVGMTLIVLGGVLVCGLVAALMDFSAIRSFFLGVGWCALVVLVALACRVAKPAALDALPPALRLAEATLNPVFIDKVQQLNEGQKQAAETKKELENQLSTQENATKDARAEADETKQELAQLKEALPGKLEEAEKRGAEAKATELRPGIQQKEKELESVRRELDKAKKRASKGEDAWRELDETLNGKVKDLESAQAELQAARKRIEELEAAAVAREVAP